MALPDATRVYAEPYGATRALANPGQFRRDSVLPSTNEH
jgi:hypothetical protein